MNDAQKQFLRELDAYLSTPEGEQSLFQFMDKEAESRKKVAVFFGTKAFEDTFVQIKRKVAAEGRFTSDGVFYTHSSTEQSFYMSCERVTEALFMQHSDQVYTDSEETFHTEVCDYNGVRFGRMYGQGVCYFFQQSPC
ncbi:hypothetical protein [Neptuniibacter sp. QD37_11]|uniref:hypothetical protein n=1 Tax=Neptuniibacter sp. QD37_11 TaxID=3398209 RepID=UPI0039F4FB1C